MDQCNMLACGLIRVCSETYFLKPIADGGQRNKSHEPAGEFFVPGGNRAVLLESLEEILHMVSMLVVSLVIRNVYNAV